MLLPGAEEPPLYGTLLMLGAGVAWGIYSLRSRGVGHPTKETPGNFLRSEPLAPVVSAVMFTYSRMDYTGVACAGHREHWRLV
jgi:hypothetical protein